MRGRRPAASSSAAVGVERELGSARGDAAEVAVPEAGELERVVERLRAARRSARRARSVNSVSRRLCSFFGRYWSSSWSAVSTSSLAAAPRAPARSSTARHGRSCRPGRAAARGRASRPPRAASGRRRARARAPSRRRRGSAARRPARPRAGRRATGAGARAVRRRRVEAHRLAAAGDRRQHL